MPLYSLASQGTLSLEQGSSCEAAFLHLRTFWLGTLIQDKQSVQKISVLGASGSKDLPPRTKAFVKLAQRGKAAWPEHCLQKPCAPVWPPLEQPLNAPLESFVKKGLAAFLHLRAPVG